MAVIYQENCCFLIAHDRQHHSYQLEDGSFGNFSLKEILFENFKRKQKIKAFQGKADGESSKAQDALENTHDPTTTNSTDNTEIINNFLKSCKAKKFFPTTSHDVIEQSKQKSIELLNEFYFSSYSLGSFHGENNLKHGKVISMSGNSYLIPPECKFFNKRIEDIEAFLPQNEINKFDFIVVDPPWQNRYIKRVKKNTSNKQGYWMMSDDEIVKIPLENYIKDSTIVVIWCTNASSHITAVKEKFLKKWNLKLLSTWQWVKVDKNGELFCAIDGNKKPFEQIFVATHEGNRKYDRKLEENVLVFSHPSAIHSHKPGLLDIFRSHLPPQPHCLEIFARNLNTGFTSIGLEVLRLQNFLLYERCS